MPEDILIKEEVRGFCMRLDKTISYLGSLESKDIKLSEEDERMYNTAYYTLKKLEEIL